jgi:lipopolysaccharide/colanic/teichoic acid biosynthesis glycosyltransferase
LFDIVISAFGLIVASPALVPAIIAVWLQDRHSPFYVAPRVARGGGDFAMVKIRSMVVDADKTGVNSTSASDARITKLGRFIRRYKLDEITQLWNVLKGDMSLVGPRPNVRSETDLYTAEERRLLSVKPGITDLASIVFSDEGDILKDSADPDLDYNRLIRPWKSRLGLFCIDHSSLALDMRLVMLTAVAILNRPRALMGAQSLLKRLGADDDLMRVASRTEPLTPALPPGATQAAAAQGGV